MLCRCGIGLLPSRSDEFGVEPKIKLIANAIFLRQMRLLKRKVDRHQIGKTGSFWLPPKASFKTQSGHKSQVLSENKNNPQDFKIHSPLILHKNQIV